MTGGSVTDGRVDEGRARSLGNRTKFWIGVGRLRDLGKTWPILPHGFVRRSEVVPLAVRTGAWNIWGGMFFLFFFKNLELTPSQNPMDMIDFQEEFSSVFWGSSLN